MKKKTIDFFRKYGISILPFLLMYFGILLLGMKVNFFVGEMVAPNILFTVVWILLVLFVSEQAGKVIGRILYGVWFVITFLLFLTNCIYFLLTNSFFTFHLMQLASEGSAYIADTIVHTNPLVYIYSLLVIVSGVFGFRHLPVKERADVKMILKIVVIFLVLHTAIPLLYGGANKKLKWNSFQKPRNIYANFYDKNKAMKICGFYEYGVRDFYQTFLKPEEKEDSSELALLEKEYSKKTIHAKNKETGIYAGKNVIFLQLEGIDSWLLTKETMPNLYNLVHQSKDFVNHYSYYNGGGSTFNSELAVNTGFITPVSYTRNAYTFMTNSFPYSLPKLLKQQGYQVNAFHMNTGEFYSREPNYKNWGYDAYHGLVDEEKYKDKSYELDRELIENKDFYKMIFNKNQPFMDYIITYTPHKPFDNSNEAALLLLKEKYGNQVPELSEEEYAKLMAGETDRMIGLLMKGLSDNGLLDNTIIVGYTDHYLYTLSDKTILDKYKTTSNNLINQTPFFIWSNGEKYQKIEKVNAQIDILPTVLNLMGISYTEENYIGNDIFSSDYSGYAFFSDGSMYDGKTYTENANLPQIQKNDLTLKYDYFAK